MNKKEIIENLNQVIKRFEDKIEIEEKIKESFDHAIEKNAFTTGKISGMFSVVLALKSLLREIE